jgi:DNA-binding NtrC family response regulator
MRTREGVFERQRRRLLLDEITEMRSTCSRLLRVLETAIEPRRWLERSRVDCASSRRPIARRRRPRRPPARDIYYRPRSDRQLPPLRERGDDVLPNSSRGAEPA